MNCSTSSLGHHIVTTIIAIVTIIIITTSSGISRHSIVLTLLRLGFFGVVVSPFSLRRGIPCRADLQSSFSSSSSPPSSFSFSSSSALCFSRQTASPALRRFSSLLFALLLHSANATTTALLSEQHNNHVEKKGERRSKVGCRIESKLCLCFFLHSVLFSFLPTFFGHRKIHGCREHPLFNLSLTTPISTGTSCALHCSTFVCKFVRLRNDALVMAARSRLSCEQASAKRTPRPERRQTGQRSGEASAATPRRVFGSGLRGELQKPQPRRSSCRPLTTCHSLAISSSSLMLLIS